VSRARFATGTVPPTAPVLADARDARMIAVAGPLAVVTGAWRRHLALVLFTAGSALVVSCANLFFRDVKYIVQVLLSFGIFFTPVFFEPEMFGPLGARLMMLNPLAPILEGQVGAHLGGHRVAPVRIGKGHQDHAGVLLGHPDKAHACSLALGGGAP